MPKASKSKYYAVKLGRDGPKIYSNWDECKAKVSRFPGAVHKSFTSLKQAEEWLNVPVTATLGSSRGPQMSRELPTFRPHNQTLLETPISSVSNQDPFSSQADSFSTIQYDPNPLSGAGMPATSEVVLSPEQLRVLQMVRERQSVFFTGSAGTGKSVLLREIIKTLEAASSAPIGITASTGIASVNIGGTTIHSWAGIGLGEESAKKMAGKILGQPKYAKVRERWCEVETLIIDEVSMIDGDLFDKLEHMGRILRGNEEPFGGYSGDFCQLPPVPNRKDGVQIPSTFAFESKSWDRCVGPRGAVTLTRVFRQKDQAFVDMLNSMRFGQLAPKIVEEFKKLSRVVNYTDGIGPTQLYPTRREVDNANETRLRQLPGQPHTYQSMDTPGRDAKGERISAQIMDRLLERLIAAKMVTLKVGAQVMLIKNLIQGELVNGSVGQVVEFRTSRDALEDHTEIARVDDTNDSRASKARRNPVLQTDRVWPVVRFTNGRTMLIVPVEFTINNAQGEMEAKREQVPLILAWALSIHKSQGQTLERVKVDLSRIFEKGQAYVALSRATSMQTLEVHNFNTDKVIAHPRVLAWHNKSEQDSTAAQHAVDGYISDEMDNDEAMTSYHAM